MDNATHTKESQFSMHSKAHDNGGDESSQPHGLTPSEELSLDKHAEVSMSCRFCGGNVTHSMVDLGLSPLCETFPQKHQLEQPETFIPLEVMVCTDCWLAQTRYVYSNADIFDADYGYFSSFSASWLKHASDYAEMAIERFKLDQNSFVVEVASNDGYLLKNFVEQQIPCLGIDPAANVANAAIAIGVDTNITFFTEELADSMRSAGKQADLIIGNNVIAHTPYINDFIAGVSVLLKPEGTATFEFPHLQKLIEEGQFDTIYHEHYSYYSLYTMCRMFDSVNMQVVDVQQLNSAGGSLRVFVEHKARGTTPAAIVNTILKEEAAAGLRKIQTYLDFGPRAKEIKWALLSLLIDLQREGKSVMGYGAPGKGNTLLNYCGIKEDLLPLTCDKSLHKHGRFCPGSRIPIFPAEHIDVIKPDYILILPWNLKTEIMDQLSHAREWGAKFILPVPFPVIVD